MEGLELMVNMTNVYFDTETRSGADIKLNGAKCHLNHPDADLICIAYRIGIDNKTNLWQPGEDTPEVFLEPDKHLFHAFNIQFDMEAINVLGPKHGFQHLPLENCRDIQALVARFGLPQSLLKAGEALGVDVLKDKIGKRLMDKIVYPPWQYTYEEFEQFLKYCVIDVNSMCAIIRALPTDSLSELEQLIWTNTAKINAYGIPVDAYSALRIFSLVERYRTDQLAGLSELTEGKVKTIGQIKAIRKYIKSKGGQADDLTKETVTNILVEKPEWLTPRLKRLLELRAKFGKTSTDKFSKLINQSYKGRLYNNLRYFGGHTGRESGNAFQIHSLPRNDIEDVESAITSFYDYSILDTDKCPVETAKNLIRPMIRAEEGTLLAVLDYSSIEYRILHWLVKNEEELEEIRAGSDRYVSFASLLYKVPEDEVTKKQRGMGKEAILAAGYCLSAATLYNRAIARGLDITEEEAQDAIFLFRRMFPKITSFWNSLNNCARNAILCPGKQFATLGCTYEVAQDLTGRPWLTLLLPSGRSIFYCEPILEKGEYGPLITHMGVHPTKKKWMRLDYRTTKMVENICQALARDVLMDGRLEISNHYDVLASVHDENIVEIPEANYVEHWNVLEKIMSTPPSWCKDLPLAVSGYCERRYRKD